MTQTQFKISTYLGTLYLVASEKGLQSLSWDKHRVPMAKSLSMTEPTHQILAQAADELEEYLSGSRKNFGVKLDLQGTPFQTRVWKALAKIPYGKTCSYRDIAIRIKNPKAVRAVGSANGKNPICVIIPCHRVIANNGTIGGYSGGLEKKRVLLGLEQA